MKTFQVKSLEADLYTALYALASVSNRPIEITPVVVVEVADDEVALIVEALLGSRVVHQPAGDLAQAGVQPVATGEIYEVKVEDVLSEPRLCSHCKQPLGDGAHKGAKYCKRKECVHERWRIDSAERLAKKKAEQARQTVKELVCETRTKKPAPGYVVQDGDGRGDTISSEELGLMLRSKRIAVGTRLLHPKRGMYKVVAKPNGSLGMVSDGKAA